MSTQDQLLSALAGVNEPESGQSLASLGMIEDVLLEGAALRVKINLLTPAYPFREQLEQGIRGALQGLPGAPEVRLEFSSEVRSAPQKDALPGVKNIVSVGSGKGGVGKSTVAANLAASLALEGLSVGLLDADIYGPSQAKMFSTEGKRLMADDEKHILPLKSCGVRVISIANLVEDGQALTWRGPILHGTLTQLLKQTLWGELDYLIVDMPPGTGDVQLSLAQLAPLTGGILVATPQDVALLDVRRAYTMLRKTHVPVLGLLENMAYYQLPDGSRDYIFGGGGAEAFAQKENLPILGQIPITRQLRESGDLGQPIVVSHPESESAKALRRAARLLVAQVNLQNQMTLPVL